MALDFSSVDPYLALLAAAKGVPYDQLGAADKNERNEAKIWFLNRSELDMPNWSPLDPRVVLESRKHASLVVLRPHPSGKLNWQAGTAFSDTDEEWTVLTSFSDRPILDADDAWPEGWMWILAPKKEG